MIKGLGERYLASIRKYRRTDRPFFTDKMPSNWRFAGLIGLGWLNYKAWLTPLSPS